MSADLTMPPCPGQHSCGGLCHTHHTEILREFAAIVDAQDWTESKETT